MNKRELQELLDRSELLDIIGHVARCPGGRPILEGLICTICGRDTSTPGQTCGAPLNKDGSPSKRIPGEVIEE